VSTINQEIIRLSEDADTLHHNRDDIFRQAKDLLTAATIRLDLLEGCSAKKQEEFVQDIILCLQQLDYLTTALYKASELEIMPESDI